MSNVELCFVCLVSDCRYVTAMNFRSVAFDVHVTVHR